MLSACLLRSHSKPAGRMGEPPCRPHPFVDFAGAGQVRWLRTPAGRTSGVLRPHQGEILRLRLLPFRRPLPVRRGLAGAQDLRGCKGTTEISPIHKCRSPTSRRSGIGRGPAMGSAPGSPATPSRRPSASPHRGLADPAVVVPDGARRRLPSVDRHGPGTRGGGGPGRKAGSPESDAGFRLADVLHLPTSLQLDQSRGNFGSWTNTGRTRPEVVDSKPQSSSNGPTSTEVAPNVH